MPRCLYPRYKNVEIIKSLGFIVKNTATFVEKLKVIFEQKGYVAVGIKATVLVNKKKLAFSM